MTNRVLAYAASVLTFTVAISFVTALAQSPEGVSPGAADRIAEVEGRCPTFIWGSVLDAQAYELVVYRLPNEPQASGTAELDLSGSDQVLYAEVPGGANAWQPELADGLDPGGTYIWFVRAVFREVDGEIVEVGDWSTGRFFSIPAAPSHMEVEEALSVLRRFASQDGEGVADLDQPTTQDRPNMREHSASRRSSAPSPESLKSVPTATAAIKGTVPDATGETYGVVGISNSPDGAGVAAANTAGGPDFVLDGSEDLLADAELSQSGIDRPWGTPQTFDISNSGGGGMMLRVDGVEVTTTESELDAAKLTSGTIPDGRLTGSYSQPLTLSNPANQFTGSGVGLTGVDADTLDGTNGAAFATDAEAVGLVAAHATSADHDGRYFTEVELSTSGATDAVHWDNLGGVPSGFADGVDDDTAYSPGPGLLIDDGQIRIDPTAFSTRLSTVDNISATSEQTSIVIGADSLGLIAYYDAAIFELKVAHCDDITCTSSTTTTVDSSGDVGSYPSIAIGVDGFGLISYYDNTSDDLKVAHCENTACTSATINTLDSSGNVGQGTSIAIGTDGLGLISYVDGANQSLKVAHCDDIVCTTADISTLNSSSDVGPHTSLAIGSDGLGLISYVIMVPSNILMATHCDNTECTSATTSVLSFFPFEPRYPSITIGSDGLGLISYYEAGYYYLNVGRCINAACTNVSMYSVDVSDSSETMYSSITIGADGFGFISYYDPKDHDLYVARCLDEFCANSATTVLDSSGFVGKFSSITIGSDGLALISYWDEGGDDLMVAHLGIGVP